MKIGEFKRTLLIIILAVGMVPFLSYSKGEDSQDTAAKIDAK